MNTISLSLLITLAINSNTALGLNDNSLKGKQLFIQHCSSCHGVSGGMDMNKRIAPPMTGVRMHYINTFTDELSFINAIADWVESPDKKKSMMPGAIHRFNLMPKINISRREVESIALYIYKGNIEAPAGMKEHIEKMHGTAH